MRMHGDFLSNWFTGGSRSNTYKVRLARLYFTKTYQYFLQNPSRDCNRGIKIVDEEMFFQLILRYMEGYYIYIKSRTKKVFSRHRLSQ